MAQREAMEKLGFLVGTWAGEARMLRGPGVMVDLVQTEDARYRLDGLILTIEGRGRAKADGAAVLEAFGILSYDDENAVYRMRAFNDGRWLESEVALTDDGKGITWGFVVGEIRTRSVLRINEAGEWTERAEIFFGAQEPKTLLELTVRRREEADCAGSG